MKKLLYIAIACVSMSSCMKDYTCECKTNSSTTAGMNEQTFSVNTASKAEASRRCSDYQHNLNVNAFNYNCSVK